MQLAGQPLPFLEHCRGPLLFEELRLRPALLSDVAQHEQAPHEQPAEIPKFGERRCVKPRAGVVAEGHFRELGLSPGRLHAVSGEGGRGLAWGYHLLPRLATGGTLAHAEDLLGSRVQADHLPAVIEHHHARVHLFDHRLAGSRQRVKDAKAEQRDGIACERQ